MLLYSSPHDDEADGNDGEDSCSESGNDIFSVCYSLNSEDMDEVHEVMGNYNDTLFLLGLFTDVVSFTVGITGVTIISMNGVALFALGAGTGGYGDTIAISDYILVKKYTVTATVGQEASWGLTNITPVLLHNVPHKGEKCYI